MPDIDVDFCERRRGEVIDYVTRKYGRENVAQIITFGTMKAKAVVRDVGRALDMPYADVNNIAKQIPAGARHDARQGARREPCPQGHGGEGPEGQGSHRHRQAPRGDVAPRVGARRRRGHRAGSDHRLRAALQGRARRNRHPVEHEGGRAGRPPEDGLPGAEHAHADRRRAQGDQADRGDRPRHRQHPARRRRRPTRCSRKARRSASSSSRAPACANCCARRGRSASTT